MRELVESSRNTLFYSSISIWECEIKIAKGRLQVSGDPVGMLKTFGVVELAFSSAHAREIGQLPLNHEDPFDRALLAQARVEDLVLVTTDRQLGRYDVRTEIV
jgi:PIN domain nuclease of toxin-antitoxin system